MANRAEHGVPPKCEGESNQFKDASATIRLPELAGLRRHGQASKRA
jgi:hypothetical protein